MAYLKGAFEVSQVNPQLVASTTFALLARIRHGGGAPNPVPQLDQPHVCRSTCYVQARTR